MDHAEVLAAFSDPSLEGVVPAPTADASAARRLRDAVEPIAMHSVWSAGTHERLSQFGLDFMGAYVQSRAALLGRPDPGVVAAAFAVFEPTMLQDAFEATSGIVDPEVLLAARLESTAASLASVLEGQDVSAVADSLQQAVATADGTGRPLFSGLARQPWPDEPMAKLWRACEQIREHRGDSHVAVCVARGLTPIEMNIMTELWVGMPLGSYTASRAWSEEAIAAAAAGLAARGLVDAGNLTEAGRQFRSEIEQATDALEQPIVDALGDIADDVIASLSEWSQRCVAAGQFPNNPYKRAAG